MFLHPTMQNLFSHPSKQALWSKVFLVTLIGMTYDYDHITKSSKRKIILCLAHCITNEIHGDHTIFLRKLLNLEVQLEVFRFPPFHGSFVKTVKITRLRHILENSDRPKHREIIIRKFCRKLCWCADSASFSLLERKILISFLPKVALVLSAKSELLLTVKLSARYLHDCQDGRGIG